MLRRFSIFGVVVLQYCTPILDLDEQIVEAELLPMESNILLVLSPKFSGAMAKTMVEHSIHDFIHSTLEFIVGVGEMGCEFEAAQLSVKLHMALVIVGMELLTALDDC